MRGPMYTSLSPAADRRAVGDRVRPSVVDRLRARIDRLPVPAWSCYALAWLVLFVIQTAVKWWDGSYSVGTFFPFHAVFSGSAVYALAVMHRLDRDAERGFATFEPVLTVDEATKKTMRERLTTMPATPALWMSVLGVCWAVFLRFGLIPPYLDALLLSTSAVATVIDLTLLGLFWAALSVLIFHSVHQLLVVSELYRRAQIDLFRIGPLYAFAPLAARTSISLLILAYAWFATVPGAMENEILLAIVATLGLIGVPLFVLPLLGVRRRLVAEKHRLLDELHVRARDTLERFHASLEASDASVMDAHHKAVATLDLEQARIERMSTWPWQAATLRGLLPTVLLPLFVWSVQQALLRWMG